MKMYAVMFTKCQDEDYDSGILNNKMFANEMDANTLMLEEAQLTLDDWNQSPPNGFKIELYPKAKSVSVCGEFESDYYDLSIVELED